MPTFVAVVSDLPTDGGSESAVKLGILNLLSAISGITAKWLVKADG